MKKNVWDMTDEDIALIDGKRYKFNKDLKKFMPALGTVLTRELVNIDNRKNRQLFSRSIEVEIE